jgi:hypothetical protein
MTKTVLTGSIQKARAAKSKTYEGPIKSKERRRLRQRYENMKDVVMFSNYHGERNK